MCSHYIILLLLLRSIPHSFAKSWFSWSKDEDDFSSLVSPIVNRELEASVVAHAWPFTLDNIVCEAWAYHHSDWEFMDALVARLQDQQETITKISEATQLVKDATLKPTDKSLLEYALSLRAYSPQCELHRGLARQVLLAHEKQLVSLDAFVVAGSAMVSDLTNIPSLAVSDLSATNLLPGEVPKGGKDGFVAILYANMTTPSFVEWYRALVDAKLPFVVRHLGHVWYEEVGGTPTVLQGYGVRLDIRNVEYRVFDDRNEQPSETAAMINVTSLSTLSSRFLAGVNVSALGLTEHEAMSLQEQLYKTHDAQQLHSQIIPPGWNRRQLSLQAAAAVSSSSSDMLMTLQDVSQNLPSVASTLVHLQVSDELTELAKNMEGLLSRTNGAALFVNGRRVPIDRPSFNVFDFLNVMKEEQAELEKMQTRLSPFLSWEALVQVQRAWSMGEEALADSDGDSGHKDGAVRINVGRGYKGAVLYVNDLEKDPQYVHWPRQVRNMVFAQAIGGSPAVRRNLFTVLGVADPLFDDDENPGIMLATQLMQGDYPARLGVLIVNQADLNACAEWVRKEKPEDDVPCPVSPVFAPESTPDKELMEELEASTHASFQILSHVIANYSMAAPSYLQYWTQSISKYKEQRQENLSLNDLIMIHGQLMSGMQIEDMEEAMNTVVEILKADEGAEDSLSYGKALRFAISKGVKSGMSFINGRPVPSAESAGEVFMEEQNHIFRLIMDGNITDTGPKSVYAMLLTGDRVYDRVHPLLTASQGGKNPYVSLTHGFDASSLFVPQKQKPSETPDSIFLVEAVLDLESPEGKKFAVNFIETMEAIPGEEGEGDGRALAYRILPRTASSATIGLCTILAHASKFEVTSLLETLKRVDISQMTVEEILDVMPGMSDGNSLAAIISDASACSNLTYLESDLPLTPFVVANGHIFSPEDAAMNKQDLELLLSVELSRAKGITKFILPHLSFQGNMQYDAIAQTASFLSEQNSKDDRHRSDMEGMVLEMEETLGIQSNPLRYFWNEPSDGDLKIKVSAVVDPISEPTQRLVPLLQAARDHLKLPLSVILAPQSVTDDNIPITSYYRFVADPLASPDGKPPRASFAYLPANHILTLRLDVPESWNVQQTSSIQDTDNLRCDVKTGCGDDAQSGTRIDRKDLTHVEYGLKNLLVFGQCYDASTSSPPNGLQLTLSQKPVETTLTEVRQLEVGSDGSVREAEGESSIVKNKAPRYADTLVMKTVGYWQLRANPGVWDLNIAPESRGAEIFDFVRGVVKNGKLRVEGEVSSTKAKTVVVRDFVNSGELLVVKRREGYEKATLFYEKEEKNAVDEEEVINVFSLATGHLYERFLKIMMLSVTKRTSSKVKFWLFENFLSPTFKESAMAMAERIGCEVEFVTYKWPEWLRGQHEKQRIIWGYKILFLDVLFPLNVKKFIYVDADQVVRGDLKELWDMDLHGAPYGYTPMCSSRETTLGFQFWRSGFWKSHLGDKPYHISALYVVDLQLFRRNLVGDQLRSVYQQLSSDPNSLANLDQDLPNYAQHQVPIFSLPQEWLWCESWCSDETKATAKTIDLCNNPLHKEPKVSMAKRIISGKLFNESWVELDQEVEGYEREFLESQTE